ncbi:hypothetical protein [Amycolatopsis sp. lyj-346]|uniref:hypothetical protein n=1 Tax=Amycolatopsis sp. lyj-346 TaxID=2789289 RepID=UPI0039780129
MADSRSDGVAVPWLAGVVLAGIGAGLAVVALTFPWVAARVDSRYPPFPLTVTSIERQGPTFAVLLVLTAMGAVLAFSAARRRAGIRWLPVVVCAPLPALAALVVGLRANAADLRTSLPSTSVDPEQLRPDLLVTAAQGLVFYTTGLLLIGLGVAIAGAPAATRIPLATTPDVPPARRPPVLRLTALVLAVPLVVLSQALPWFEIDNPGNELPAVVTGWPGIYRAGLIAILVLLVTTAVTTGWPRATARTAALYVCGGLYGVLLINAWLLWDPSGMADRLSAQRTELALGLGFFAALATVPLLAIVVGPRITEPSDGEPTAGSAPEPGPHPEAAPAQGTEPTAGPGAESGLHPEAARAQGTEPTAGPGAEGAAGRAAGPEGESEAEPAMVPVPEAERKPQAEPQAEPRVASADSPKQKGTQA